MRRSAPMLRCWLAALFLVQPLLTAPARGEKFLLSKLKGFVSEAEYHGTEPCTGCDGAIECLAENIDWLEHHIDTYGSIVAKQPDIWGEARLTKHRDEYERVLFAKLDDWEYSINASISQSDSSFLAQAIALSAAAGGVELKPASGAATVVPSVVSEQMAVKAPLVDANGEPLGFSRFGVAAKVGEPGIKLEPVIQLDQLSRYVQHLHELRRINEGDDTSDSPGYSLNLVRIPVSILPGKMTRTGFGAEVTVTATPVLSDDLMPTTFRNLAVNDVVDMLGLPLVRTAEAILYGNMKATQAGNTVSSNIDGIQSVLDEWFETVEEGAVAGTEVVLADETKSEIGRLISPYMAAMLSDGTARDTIAKVLEKLVAETAPTNSQSVDLSSKAINKYSSGRIDYAAQIAVNSLSTQQRSAVEQQSESLITLLKAVKANNPGEAAEAIVEVYVDEGDAWAVLEIAIDEALKTLARLAAEESQAITPSGRTRRAFEPINPSFLLPVINIKNLLTTANAFVPKYEGRSTRWNGGQGCNAKPEELRIDLLDARRFLQAQLEAAYELLSQKEHLCLFATMASPGSGLAQQIRGGHLSSGLNQKSSPIVAQYRHYFFQQLHKHGAPGAPINCPLPMLGCYASEAPIALADIYAAESKHEAANSVEALAWTLVVEAALLNERLNLDVRKLAKAKEAYDLDTARDYLFFLPDTVTGPGVGLEELNAEFQQATQVFQRYVQARWPIHVFAIDPREQDQNVADVSARKRELQFALALGFATGQIGVNSLTQFSRELQTQIETISLNRTQVGFGHGADTFGWRFMPRVQALPVPGTFGAIRETLCGTPRDYDLKHRQLEPGQRECVAVVLMPSFVPYADFDIRTNWFKLTNPKNAALTMKDTMRLSRAITAMRNSRAQCAQCQHLYRDGELGRLFKRVEQLDRELPLQTQRALVPYENTLGGFEMFNTGVTDLSPELIGWYGAPGVRIGGDACGCYQGCQLVSGDCKGEDCTKVKADIAALTAKVQTLSAGNVAFQASPIPECEGPGTTLFLVGDNFSVHDTKVIAGGVCIPHTQLISRELMRVTIPDCVSTVHLCENGKNNEYVSVYVATPYGVTNHLHVPVHRPVEKPAPAEAAAITVAVNEAVGKAKTDLETAVSQRFEGHELPLQKISLSKTFNTLTIDAAQEPGSVTFVPEQKKEIEYRVQSDPQLGASRGVSVEFSVALWGNGQYLSPLATLVPAAELADCGKFNALPADGGKAFVKLIRECLQCNCRCQGENANAFKLVYYAKAKEENVATRLGSVDLIVKGVEDDCLVTEQTDPNARVTPAAGGVVLEGSQTQDCGCEPTRAASRYSVQPITHTTGWQEWPTNRVGGNGLLVTPASSSRVPARYAQLTEEQAEQVLERLGGVSADLDALRTVTEAQQEELKQEFKRLEALQSATVPPGQSNINVSLAYPQPPTQPEKDSWWDDKKHPLVNQATTRARECWHNVRDQLPCN